MTTHGPGARNNFDRDFPPEAVRIYHKKARGTEAIRPLDGKMPVNDRVWGRIGGRTAQCNAVG